MWHANTAVTPNCTIARSLHTRIAHTESRDDIHIIRCPRISWGASCRLNDFPFGHHIKWLIIGRSLVRRERDVAAVLLAVGFTLTCGSSQAQLRGQTLTQTLLALLVGWWVCVCVRLRSAQSTRYTLMCRCWLFSLCMRLSERHCWGFVFVWFWCNIHFARDIIISADDSLLFLW